MSRIEDPLSGDAIGAVGSYTYTSPQVADQITGDMGTRLFSIHWERVSPAVQANERSKTLVAVPERDLGVNDRDLIRGGIIQVWEECAAQKLSGVEVAQIINARVGKRVRNEVLLSSFILPTESIVRSEKGRDPHIIPLSFKDLEFMEALRPLGAYTTRHHKAFLRFNYSRRFSRNVFGRNS